MELINNTVGYNPILFCKICRILKYVTTKIFDSMEKLKEDSSEDSKIMIEQLSQIKNKLMIIIKEGAITFI